MSATDVAAQIVAWGLPFLLAFAWAFAVRPPAPVPRVYWLVALAAAAWLLLTRKIDTETSLVGFVGVWGVPVVAIRWAAAWVGRQQAAAHTQREDTAPPVRRAA